jgi:hypothetical protein
MPQNLLTPQAGSASMRSRCPLQYIHLGFRTHEQVRYFNAIARIDFVATYGLLIDLLW